MPRPEFSQAGTNGGGQTIAVNNRPSFEKIVETDDTTVPANGDTSVEVFAPEGSIYRLKSLFVRAGPIGSATTGNHQVDVRPMGIAPSLKAMSKYDDSIIHGGNTWSTATKFSRPPGNTAPAVSNVRASESSPIELAYKNFSDGTQDSERKFELVVEVVTY